MHDVWLNYYEVHLYITTSQIGVKRKGNAYTYVGTEIHVKLIGHTDRPMGLETTNTIILDFIWIRIQLEL